MTKIQSFEPISNFNSKILILGTIPGNESLNSNQYYAHPSNHFWDIMFRILKDDYDFFKIAQESESYDKKINLLINNKIALWDILKYCERKGNLDKDIRNELKNDFDSFFHNHSEIVKIIFNGQKAHDYFIESFNHILSQQKIKFKILNSTSSSNTRNVFKILKEWRDEIIEAL